MISFDRTRICFKHCFITLAILWFSTQAFALQIQNITQNAASVGRFEKLEITFTLNKTFSNPFDPAIADVTAVFHLPNQAEVIAPAFVYRLYEVSGSNPESYSNPGPEQWKVRYAPSAEGAYTFDIVVNEGGTVTRQNNAGTFTCTASSRKGFIRLHPADGHCMQYDDGSARMNIGHNVCWATGFTGYQNYHTKMGSAGENWTRIWMTHFTTQILEWRSDWSSYYQNLGRYSLQISQRYDSIVEDAMQKGIAIQLVLQHHGQFSSTVNSNWNDNPYNIANAAYGGFLNSPADFFTSAEARRLTKNKYRYIVARWGYSPAIFAWELWNEVQFTDGWNSNRPAVVAWHQEMADYIRSIDPHSHLITTSSDGGGFADIWNQVNMDSVQFHKYGSPTIESYYGEVRGLQNSYNKPVMMAEFGISVNGAAENNPNAQPEPQRTQLLQGLPMHNGIWSTALAKSSGNLWWWDGYINPHNLYGVFTPLADYLENEDFAGLQQSSSIVNGSQPMIAVPGVSTFSYISPQTEFWWDGERFAGIETLCKYFHGSTKPDYISNPKFHLTMPTEGSLIISVSSTANWCTNSLKVMVNDSEVFSQSYPANSSNFQITVPLPAGVLAVQIVNTGQDWFVINSYEFRPAVTPVINAIGLKGSNRGYYWIYDINSQYGLTNHGLLSNQQVSIPGLADGRYVISVWDTFNTGGMIHQEFADSATGVLNYTLPAFTGDTALKIKPAEKVGTDDLLALASNWLRTGPGNAADFYPDEKIDIKDLRELSGYWLDYRPLNWPFE